MAFLVLQTISRVIKLYFCHAMICHGGYTVSSTVQFEALGCVHTRPINSFNDTGARLRFLQNRWVTDKDPRDPAKRCELLRPTLVVIVLVLYERWNGNTVDGGSGLSAAFRANGATPPRGLRSVRRFPC